MSKNNNNDYRKDILFHFEDSNCRRKNEQKNILVELEDFYKSYDADKSINENITFTYEEDCHEATRC